MWIEAYNSTSNSKNHMTPLQRITERVSRLGHPDSPETPRPLLEVEEFFANNFVVGSIGCNVYPTPEPAQFSDVLKAIALRADVSDVRVQITAFDDPEWPFSDTVYIMTSASLDEVASWFPEELKPDETWSGFLEQSYEPYSVPTGTAPVACWWD
jgi:hypothetical protein